MYQCLSYYEEQGNLWGEQSSVEWVIVLLIVVSGFFQRGEGGGGNSAKRYVFICFPHSFILSSPIYKC